MFSTWDLVRPRFWYPMASFEQSMMDLDRMADQMMAPFPFETDMQMLTMPSANEDDDFFSDLPMHAQQQPTPQQPVQQQQQQPVQQPVQQKPVQKQQQQPVKQQAVNQQQQAPAQSDNTRAFSSYSYTSSSVLDDKGQQVKSTRRRYEDSTGRLKALHERQLGDKKVRTVWQRQNKQDEGKHEVTCSGTASDEFEKLWKQTAFGSEEEKKKVEAIKEKAEDAKSN